MSFIELKIFADKSGTLYDLSSLSLPNDNYELHTSGTDKFLVSDFLPFT